MYIISINSVMQPLVSEIVFTEKKDAFCVKKNHLKLSI